jgi:hypothetical protein
MSASRLSCGSAPPQSSTGDVDAGHHGSPRPLQAFRIGIHDGSGRYKYNLLSLSHIVFSHQVINSLPQTKNKAKTSHLPLHQSLPASIQSSLTKPLFSPISIQPYQNTMASAMYRPSFTRSTSPSNASISSKSSTTSSVRAIYTRDGQGWELSTSYPSSGIDTKTLVALPAFSRAEYSRDARGVDVDFSTSYKFSKQQIISAHTPFKGCIYAKDGKGIDFSSSYKGY